MEELLKTVEPNAKMPVLAWYSPHPEVGQAFRAHLCENKQTHKKTVTQPPPYNTGTVARPGFILTQAEAPKTLAVLWGKFDDLFENGAELLTDDWPPKRSQAQRF